jgi:hypothetical protein
MTRLGRSIFLYPKLIQVPFQNCLRLEFCPDKASPLLKFLTLLSIPFTRTTIGTNKFSFVPSEHMDPRTEIREGPEVPQIPLRTRQFISDPNIRKKLEEHSAMKRYKTGQWSFDGSNVTIQQYTRFLQSLKDHGFNTLKILILIHKTMK